MKWTEEQREAIELRGKNILVSAAAGSGKTAVLVERIKRLIMEEGCPVDRMLIVTFTNAAASEMKEKIRKALSEALSMEAESGAADKAAFLRKQLDLLSSANISTFHAFSMEVIRRYFYLIDVEPNFKICDSVQETLLREEAMDKLLEQLFEEAEPEFFHFLKCYSGDRDESRFRSIVSGCYDTIRSLPEPFVWLEENVARLKDGEALSSGSAGSRLFAAAEERLSKAEAAVEANARLARSEELEGLCALCEKDRHQLSLMREAVISGDYEKVARAAADFKLPVMSSKIFSSCSDPGEIKEAAFANRNEAKKHIKELRDVYFAQSFDSLREEMGRTYEPALYLQKLLTRYDALYKAKKRERNVTDFSDIEHYAYEILKDGEAADFYRRRFRHIFIDEYQDSNVIQEALVDLIKSPDNLFMVGDVKQSIYKFRLAEPEIFQKKYADYENGLVPDSVKIDLNRNFRSKKPVIDFINGLCSQIMEGYDEKAALYPGDVHADKAFHEPELLLAQVPWEEDADIDEELKNIVKAEKEALAAAAVIRDSLGKSVFDSKQGKERPLEKRDIVILMRGVKSYGEVFYKVLADNGIPSYIDDNDGFFNTLEIDSFMSALYVMDNPKQDIPLLTFMRSEMLGFSIEEMVRIRLRFKTGSYYDAFAAYSEAGDDGMLREKCRRAFEKIDSWRELSLLMPLEQLIWRLLLDTGFYVAMGAMPAGSQRQANLRALADKALAYRSSGGGGLYGFIRYVEAVKEKKVSMGQVKLLGEKDDVVRIMTVHKSKGLEFPMVIMAGFCRKLTYGSAGKAPVIHKDLGIGFPVVDPENRWYRTTLLQNMIKERFHREEVDEEKRILYVALTRARDRLVLLGICNDIEKDIAALSKGTAKDTSYFSMTGRVICGQLKAAHPVEDSRLLGLSKGRRRSVSAIVDIVDKGGLVPGEEIRRLMEFEYPYLGDLEIKSKYSVSELSSQGKKLAEDLKIPAFASDRGADRRVPVSAAARGSAHHTVLEHMDVAAARREGKAYISSLLSRLVDLEILTDNEAASVEAGRLSAFAKSDLGLRIAEADRVFREKPFNLLTEYKGKEIIVQGMIDCFFEEEGQLVLVDYKTGRAKGAKEKYAMQIELYRRALESAWAKPVKAAYLYMTDSGDIIEM